MVPDFGPFEVTNDKEAEAALQMLGIIEFRALRAPLPPGMAAQKKQLIAALEWYMDNDDTGRLLHRALGKRGGE